MIHFATFPSCAGAERAKRLIFATRALHRTAVPSRPLYRSLQPAWHRQQWSHQACTTLAYSPQTTLSKLASEHADAASTRPRWRTAAPVPQHKELRLSRPLPHAAQPRRPRQCNGDHTARRQAHASSSMQLSRQNEAATGEIRVGGEVEGVRLVLV